jgi:hypothetical protein
MTASRLLAGIALAGFLISTSSAAAPHLKPKAAARATVASWLKLCDDDELQCENAMLKLSYEKVGCFPSGSEADSYTLTPKVRQWLKDHPKYSKAPFKTGLFAAVKDLYPCKTKSAGKKA